MDDPPPSATDSSPLEQLGLLATQAIEVVPGLDHLELYTAGGLLTVLWHGPADAEEVVVCGGGAMGGLLGPAEGLYHRLGTALAERGLGVLRVGYRQPGDLDRCVHDALAVLELAARHGARRLATVGHSFGGAVAIQAAAHLDAASAPAVVTLATQSAGCEAAELLAGRDLLLFHGSEDRILPPQASEMVRFLAGTGELVVVPSADHLFRPGWEQVLDRLVDHLPAVLARP
jgi:alpha/beta superfamily hydrolase